MNGALPGSVFKDGMRLAQKVILAVDIMFGLLAVWFAYVIFRGFKPSKRKLAKLERKQAKKQLNGPQASKQLNRPPFENASKEGACRVS